MLVAYIEFYKRNVSSLIVPKHVIIPIYSIWSFYLENPIIKKVYFIEISPT